MIIRDQYDTWLKKQLRIYIKRECYCGNGVKPTLHGNPPPTIICTECLRSVGVVPSDAWPQMEFKIKAQARFLEATAELRLELRHHPNWRCFMTTQDQSVSDIPAANIIKTIPGHIVYDSGDAAARGDNCVHIWILADDNKAKCVHCEGVRDLDEAEIMTIEAAEAAGVSFLKWPDRFDAMQKARGTTRRGRRRKKKDRKAPGVPRGIANVQAEVPSTHVSIKVAAQAMNIPGKKLRKMVRSNPTRYEAVKVGRQVYIKIPED